MSVPADILEVPAELNEALELLRENRIRLETAMTKKIAFDSDHAESAARIAAAVKSLSAEARLWADQLTLRASRSTPEQRTAASLKHLLGLPAGPRLHAMRQLVEAEARVAQPVPIRMDGPQ